MVNEFDKNQKLLLQRFEKEEKIFEVLTIIQNDQNDFSQFSSSKQETIKDLQSKLNQSSIKQNEMKSRFENLHDKIKMNLLEGTPNQIKVYNLEIQSELKELTSLVQQLEDSNTFIRQEWALAVESQVKLQQLKDKIPTQIHKITKAQKELDVFLVKASQFLEECSQFIVGLGIEGQELIQKYSKVYSNIVWSKGQMQDLVEDSVQLLEKGGEEIKEWSAQYDNLKDNGNFVQLEQIYEELYILKTQLEDTKNDGVSKMWLLKQKFTLILDFGMNEQNEILLTKLKNIVKPEMKLYIQQCKAYKQQLELQSISLVDDEEKETNIAIIRETEEIIESIEKLKKDKAKECKKQGVRNQKLLKEFIHELDEQLLTNKVDIKKVVKILLSLQKNEIKLEELIDELSLIENQIEVKNIENGHTQPKVRLDQVSLLVEEFRTQFEDIRYEEQQIDDKLQSYSEEIGQSKNPLHRFAVEILIDMMNQMKIVGRQHILEKLQRIDETIDGLGSFLDEKEQSGGIQEQEDADRLMQDLEEIEKQTVKSKNLISNFNFENQFILKVSLDYMWRLKGVIKQLIDTEGELLQAVMKINQMTEGKSEPNLFNIHQEEHSKIFNENYLNSTEEEKLQLLINQGQDIFNLLSSTYNSVENLYQRLNAESTRFDELVLTWSEDGQVISESSSGNKEVFQPAKKMNHFYVMQSEDDEIEQRINEQYHSDKKVRLIQVRRKSGNMYEVGDKHLTKLAIIQNVLCCQIVGGYIPLENFIRLMFLRLFQKEYAKPIKSVLKETFEKVNEVVMAIELIQLDQQD